MTVSTGQRQAVSWASVFSEVRLGAWIRSSRCGARPYPADGVVALLGIVATVHNQHSVPASEGVGHTGLMPPDEFGIGPGALADELLHRLDVAALDSLRHGYNQFAPDIEHLTFQVFQRPETLFLAVEQIGILAMVRDQLLLQSTHLPRRQVASGLAAGGWRRRLGNSYNQWLGSFQSKNSERGLYHFEREVTLSY